MMERKWGELAGAAPLRRAERTGRIQMDGLS